MTKHAKQEVIEASGPMQYKSASINGPYSVVRSIGLSDNFKIEAPGFLPDPLPQIFAEGKSFAAQFPDSLANPNASDF